VNAIASKQAGLPIILRRGDYETGTTIDDPRLYKLLNLNANIYETAWMFRYRLSTQLLLSRKGAFVEVVRGRDGRPSQLHLLNAEAVNPIPDPITFVSGYEVTRSDYTVQTLAPDQVIWIKLMPHPTDPYQQLTPMVSAGIVAESDWLARLFNRNFITNDGRPGLLVGIKGDTSPGDAQEIKNRFTGGPLAAGQTIVIEADDISVQDLGATPRDIEWLAGLKAGKDDLLLAFGVAESVLGNASGRTFDNADAELEGFWLHTEIDHCKGMAMGLNALTGDLDDDINLAYDFSGVEVLQRAINTRRTNKLAEVAAGAATLDDFFRAVGEKPWDIPGTRALFLPNGVVIARDPDDEKAIRNLPNLAAAAIAGMMRAESALARQSMTQGAPGAPAQAPALPGAPAAPAALPGGSQKPLAPIGGPASSFNPVQAALGVVAARAERVAAKASMNELIERKMLSDTGGDDPDIIDAEIVIEPEYKEHPYLQLRATIEATVETGLTVWGHRQEKVFLSRLDHAKVLKHTRHWDGKEVGTKALDPMYVVAGDEWSQDIVGDMHTLLKPILEREAKRAARSLHQAGVIDQMADSGRINQFGNTPLTRLFIDPEAKLYDVLGQALGIVESSAMRQSEKVAAKIAELDSQGASMTEIKKAVTKMVGARSSWKTGLAVNLTTSTVEGIRQAVYGTAADYMTKTWWTEDDERVRHTHAMVDGKSVSGGDRFTVGESKMLYPGDPAGALDEIINCRCWCNWAPKR
jgi:HK97 family phage portal protein